MRRKFSSHVKNKQWHVLVYLHICLNSILKWPTKNSIGILTMTISTLIKNQFKKYFDIFSCILVSCSTFSEILLVQVFSSIFAEDRNKYDHVRTLSHHGGRCIFADTTSNDCDSAPLQLHSIRHAMMHRQMKEPQELTKNHVDRPKWSKSTQQHDH